MARPVRSAAPVPLQWFISVFHPTGDHPSGWQDRSVQPLRHLSNGLKTWRRGWDSNPRAPCGANSFQDCPVMTASVPHQCFISVFHPTGDHPSGWQDRSVQPLRHLSNIFIRNVFSGKLYPIQILNIFQNQKPYIYLKKQNNRRVLCVTYLVLQEPALSYVFVFFLLNLKCSRYTVNYQSTVKYTRNT